MQQLVNRKVVLRSTARPPHRDVEKNGRIGKPPGFGLRLFVPASTGRSIMAPRVSRMPKLPSSARGERFSLMCMMGFVQEPQTTALGIYEALYWG